MPDPTVGTESIAPAAISPPLWSTYNPATNHCFLKQKNQQYSHNSSVREVNGVLTPDHCSLHYSFPDSIDGFLIDLKSKDTDERIRAVDPDLHSFYLLDPDPGGYILKEKTEKMQGK